MLGPAAKPGCRTTDVGGTEHVVCSGHDGGGGESDSSGEVSFAYELVVLVVTSGPDGDCVVTTVRGSDTPFSDRERSDVAATNAAIVAGGLPDCPTGPTPEGWVRAWLSTHGPAAPQPFVLAGRAVTGLPTYLATGTAEHWDETVASTPFGPLDLDGTASVSVDWGDGDGPEGPFDHAGLPYPDGDITHVYTDAGDPDIVVTYRWTIDWSFGVASGRLELSRAGTLGDFPVVGAEATITGR
jgi:hypothetical protein